MPGLFLVAREWVGGDSHENKSTSRTELDFEIALMVLAGGLSMRSKRKRKAKTDF